MKTRFAKVTGPREIGVKSWDMGSLAIGGEVAVRRERLGRPAG
jgi:hypothetical protein